MATEKKLDINKESKNLFTMLDKSMELSMLRNGDLAYKKNILPQAQKERIIGEAKAILSSELWNMIMDDMKQVACKKMYEESTDFEMLRFGKAMLYTLDVLKQKLYNLHKLK